MSPKIEISQLIAIVITLLDKFPTKILNSASKLNIKTFPEIGIFTFMIEI